MKKNKYANLISCTIIFGGLCLTSLNSNSNINNMPNQNNVIENQNSYYQFSNLNQKIKIENLATNHENEIKKVVAKIVKENSIQNFKLNFDKPKPTSNFESKISPKYKLSKHERWVTECIVAGEAGNENFEGKMAVAQCILNACLKDDLEPSEVRRKYKYSGWDENFESKYPEAYKEVKKAVSDVFDNGNKVTDEYILWFHSHKSNPKFHKTQTFVGTFGTQKFYCPNKE